MSRFDGCCIDRLNRLPNQASCITSGLRHALTKKAAPHCKNIPLDSPYPGGYSPRAAPRSRPMRDAACVRIQHFLPVFLLLLLVTVLFVISPQVAAELGSLPTLRAMAFEPQNAHRQSASDGQAAQTVSIPGGEFSMGSDEPQFPDARPWHRVHVDGFHIDKTVVTNADYAVFVHTTGYVTVAGRVPNAK